MLGSYAVLMGVVFVAFAKLVQDESEVQKRNEGLDPSVNVVLTLGDEDPEPILLRDVWRRVYNSRLFRLPARRRIPRHSGRAIAPVPHWD